MGMLVDEPFQVATALTAYHPRAAIEGIKLFLLGGVKGAYFLGGWVEVNEKPKKGLYVHIEGKWYAPDTTGMPLTETREMSGKIIRMKCDKCGQSMRIFPVAIMCDKANPNQWRTRFECSDEECLAEKYSKVPFLYEYDAWQ